MRNPIVLGLVVCVAAGCKSKPAAPVATSDARPALAMPAPHAVDAARAVDAAQVAHGPAGPDLIPGCAGAKPVPALAGLKLDAQCAATPTLLHAIATVAGQNIVMVVAEHVTLLYLGRKKIDDSRGAPLEQLAARLGHAEAIAKLGDPETAALLGVIRGLRIELSATQRLGRVGFTEAAAVAMQGDYPAVPAKHVPAGIDPAGTYLHTIAAGNRRAVTGWYETVEPTSGGADCIELYEITATLDPDGPVEVDRRSTRWRGGCDVPEPEPQNFFPD